MDRLLESLISLKDTAAAVSSSVEEKTQKKKRTSEESTGRWLDHL